MNDTEMLNLLEHYKWRVFPTVTNEWQCSGQFGHVRAPTLRNVIAAAIGFQAKRAVSPQDARSNGAAG